MPNLDLPVRQKRRPQIRLPSPPQAMEDVEVEKGHRSENHQHEAEFIAHQFYRAARRRDLGADAQARVPYPTLMR